MNLNDFKMFDSIMKNFDVPYLLGVTPNLCLDPLNWKSMKYRKLTGGEIKTLRNLEDVEIAMHGITHQTRRYGFVKRLLGFYSEFAGLDEEQTASKLDLGLGLFERYGIEKPRVLIPPFNTFDESNLNVFKKYFRFITGGSETKESIKRAGGKRLILSDKAHYGHAHEICLERRGCITIHWGWEIEDNFSKLRRLLVKLKGSVMGWGELK